jgi:hypothetical protein
MQDCTAAVLHVAVCSPEAALCRSSTIPTNDSICVTPSGFGELALLYSAPRAATVTATADCRLWVMERAFYNAIKHAHTEAVSQRKRELIDGVPLLALLRPVGHGLSCC